MMKICRVCRTENEEQFVYCKNCGTQLEAPKAYEYPIRPVYQGGQINLVPVTLMLPDINDPNKLSAQTVYVTPAQRAAINWANDKRNR